MVPQGLALNPFMHQTSCSLDIHGGQSSGLREAGRGSSARYRGTLWPATRRQRDFQILESSVGVIRFEDPWKGFWATSGRSLVMVFGLVLDR
tara:strand:+ start:865 stop:1140 length:276 start_codon:yes stop_codon:yes gene_type:complete